MPSTTRARSAFGDRVPGLIDRNVVSSPDVVFSNEFSLLTSLNTSGSVIGPSMADAATNAGITWNNIITVAIWLKYDSTGSQSSPDDFDGVANASNSFASLSEGWGMYWENQGGGAVRTMAFFTDAFSQAVESPTITDDEWNFFVGTYNVNNTSGQRIRSYVNGNNFNQGGTTSQGFTDNLTRNIEVGKTGNDQSGGPTDFGQGFHKEFAIWNVELSSGAIESLYNGGAGFTANTNYGIDFSSYASSDDLVLWWRLGDGGDEIDTADGILDQSGNGNTAISADMSVSTDIPPN